MYTWENTGRLFSYQHPPLEKHTLIRSLLCILHIKSNSFCALHFSLSPECAFREAQTCHNEDTVKCFTHTECSSLVKSFAILFFASWLSLGLSRLCLISLFVFHQSRLFLENRPLRMCKLRSCFGGMSPNQGGLKLSEFDKWARELAQLMVPVWPHTELWQARCS